MDAYQALYRKYRPQTFDDVVGQPAVTQTLKSQLRTGKLSHAYLFTGSRGTGKTTCAKILAKAVNCLQPEDGNPCNRCAACRAIDSGTCMDVLEIDAASNNGVDNVRELRDDAVYSPAQVKKRVYIIDEVHMLSLSAFNALLKIIEEPPAHLLFILATTELHKVPATILSRCQRFAFRRIEPGDIAARLQYVAYQENIELDDAAARVLARLADGGMRDALSLLDQCASASAGELSTQQVYRCLGIAGERRCAELLEKIAKHDTGAALTLFDRLYGEGKELSAMLDELACLVRDILVYKTAPGSTITMLSGVADEEQVKALSSQLSGGELLRMLSLLQKTLNLFSRSTSRRTDAELCLLEMCRPDLSADVESMNARLSRVEEQLKSGILFAQVPPRETAAHDKSGETPLQTEAADPEPDEQKQIPAPAAQEEVPAAFWQDLADSVRKELRPPASGFFVAAPDGPVQPVVEGNNLTLQCRDSFSATFLEKPEILEIVARKASILLNRPMRARVLSKSKSASGDTLMNKLLRFGEENPDVVTIKKS